MLNAEAVCWISQAQAVWAEMREEDEASAKVATVYDSSVVLDSLLVLPSSEIMRIDSMARR